MKKILIAIDCTSFAKAVALAGREITKQYPEGTEVILLHVLLQPDYYSSAQYAPILGFNEFYNKGLSDFLDGNDLQDAVHEFIESLKADLSIPTAKIMIQAGDPEKAIPEALKDTSADVLVIGKQNQASGNKYRIGHITESVLKQASVPVYVVPAPIE